MQRLPAMPGQRIAEFLADRAECDSVDHGTIAGFEPHTQMRLADFVGEDEVVASGYTVNVPSEWTGALLTATWRVPSALRDSAVTWMLTNVVLPATASPLRPAMFSVPVTAPTAEES